MSVEINSESENQGSTLARRAYVVVRCRDAGVHAGEYQGHSGREVTLANARRLWRYVPGNGAKWLSGVAKYGLANDNRGQSQIGAAVDIVLTEACEIILCTDVAAESIRSWPDDEFRG